MRYYIRYSTYSRFPTKKANQEIFTEISVALLFLAILEKNMLKFSVKRIKINLMWFVFYEFCLWFSFSGGPGDTVTLNFVELDTESGYDSLFIHDGDSRASPLLVSANGKHDPFTITSTSHQVYIRYWSAVFHSSFLDSFFR